MITILRKEGFTLNPSDKTVNALLKMIERNGGNCPCSGNTSEDMRCPCSNYRLSGNCCCGLYVKVPEDEIRVKPQNTWELKEVNNEYDIRQLDNGVLLIDICKVPQGMSIEDFITYIQETGIAIKTGG